MQSNTLPVVNVCLGSAYLLILLGMLAKSYYRVWQCWRTKQRWCACLPACPDVLGVGHQGVLSELSMMDTAVGVHTAQPAMLILS